ncbi:MAG: hypothetical protein KDC92_15440 [Bacteroidetes bacterium]|nr:hypothetical protein [Bacteroidota bacterium]
MNNGAAKIGMFFLVIGAALIAHFLYSPWGFNPTDEGFILGYSKRVLDGEIPHAHFISIRPTLSAYLHIPELLISNSKSLIISRAIAWIQFGLIAILWVNILSPKKSFIQTTALFLVGFMAITNNYPPMAWHTLDGIMLSTTGAYFLTKRKQYWWLAFLLFCMAYLCKQNFLAVGVFAIIFFPKNWPKKAATLAIPGIIYVLFLAINGAFSDFIIQMQSETSLFKTGILTYLKSIWLWLGILIGIGHILIEKKKNLVVTNYASLAVFLTVACYGLYKGQFYLGPSFLVFGWSLTYLFKKLIDDYRPIKILGLGIAWAASVSIGFNTPAMALAVAVVIVLSQLELPKSIWTVSVLAIIPFYHYGRTNYVYRDVEIGRHEYHLGNQLTGASGIYTNKRTHDLFKDLRKLKATSNKQLVLMPYSGAYWALSNSKNPASIHWTSNIEMQNDRLRERYIDEMETQRGKVCLLLPKYNTLTIGYGRYPMKYDSGFYLENYFIENWNLVSESKFFFVYE